MMGPDTEQTILRMLESVSKRLDEFFQNHEKRICALEAAQEKNGKASTQAAAPPVPSPWIPVVKDIVVWVGRLFFILLLLLGFLLGVKEIFGAVPIP